jgi:3-phosphoshikimate 1-carboxyvinyltransferase
MLAGLAEGTTRLANFSTGADPHSSLACMESLGAQVLHKEDKTIEIAGVAGAFHQPSAALDCGNSGSTMRMLTGLIASHPHTFTLLGDPSLILRPMERIRNPLIQMRANIDLTDGHAPITIHGTPLHAIDFTTPIPSAQVKTAVLFAGLQAEGTTSLSESILTRDHTEHALLAFGATLTRTYARGLQEEDTVCGPNRPARLSIPGGQRLHAIDATVPGDISSAAFFLCAALLFPDSNLVLDSLGMNPTRAALLDVIAALGGRIKVLTVEECHGELIGTIQVNFAPANRNPAPLIIGSPLTEQLIDELPVLAAIAPYTAAGLILRDAQELRVKESDRIALVAKNLRAMGAVFTEHPDGLEIPGNQSLHGATIDSGSDHRIAMAFAIAALRATGDTEILGAESAAISFPEFFSSLDSLALR